MGETTGQGKDALQPEAQRFLDRFDAAFSYKKGEKIVLYGIGAFTALILKYLKEYQVIGLMDREVHNIGKIIYGRPVISPEDAVRLADLVIIITQDPCSWDIIFQRIEWMQSQKQIPIYFPDGNQGVSNKVEKRISENPYWDVDMEAVKKQIDAHPVISFDLFDTLVMRKVFTPGELFELLEIQVRESMGLDKPLAQHRRYIETQLKNRGIGTPNLDQIYGALMEELELTKEEAAEIKEREIELEKRLIIPRKDMVSLFNYAKCREKRIYILSDMYLPADVMREILLSCGIGGYDELWVSCEKKGKKSDGTMWEMFIEAVGGGEALHIGDDENADIRNASSRGIHTVKIASAYQMLLESSFYEIVPKICTLSESVTMGCLLARMFNSPFALGDFRGLVTIQSLEDMGYLFFAPPMFHYILWVLQETKKQRMDKILFFSRDGYFFQKLYEYMKQEKGAEGPEGIYFRISRMMSSMMTIQSTEDIWRVMQMRYTGKFSEFMKYRLFTDLAPDDPHGDEEISTVLDMEKVKGWMAPYLDGIVENARKQKDRYLDYMAGFGIMDDQAVAVADPSYEGTNQYFLSCITGRKYQGYYCYACLGEHNKYHQSRWMQALYQSPADETAEHSWLNRNSTQFENGILVAPEGGVIGLLKDGSFSYTKTGETQREFYKKERMFQEVLAFVDDYFQCFQEVPAEKIPHADLFIDELFGYFSSYRCQIAKEIKDQFYVDTFFQTTFERKIWD